MDFMMSNWEGIMAIINFIGLTFFASYKKRK